MRLKALMSAGLGSLLLASLASADETTPEYSLRDNQSSTLQTGSNLVEEDEVKRLEEIIVDARSSKRKRRPNTGHVSLQPLAVKIDEAPAIFDHYNVELIVRPVRITEDGIYVVDKVKGRKFARVRVTLSTAGTRRLGSRLRKNRDLGKRNMDLPEAIYAITEVRYDVSFQIGSSGTPAAISEGREQPLSYRFCMADRTIAFDVKDGETTDLGIFLVRGLEKHFRKSSSTEHHPFLRFEAPIVDVSDPDFRNKVPERAAFGTIKFNSEGELCRGTSRQVPGWFTNDEMKDVYPQFDPGID